jgi:hypothetical protein
VSDTNATTVTARFEAIRGDAHAIADEPCCDSGVRRLTLRGVTDIRAARGGNWGA